MAVSDFFFALQLSDNTPHDAMIADVANAVGKYTGLTPAEVGDLTASLRSAVGRAGGSCDVRFLGHGGQFEIIVSHDGGKEWRTSRALP